MKKLVINLGLLITALLTMFSGLLIQIEYHMGSHGEKLIDKSVLGLVYSDWSFIHKFLIILLSVLAVFHISFHWKWYKAVVAKRLLNKNRQVITLTIVFVLVAVTGYISWITDLVEGSQMVRESFIEIHDKIAIILSIYFILHITKRLKWFLTTIEKVNKNKAHNAQS